MRFSQLRLKLDQRTLHGPHRCTVQSKVARAPRRAEPQLQHTAAGLAQLSAAGLVGTVTRYAVGKQPRTRPVVAVNADDAFGNSRALRRGAVGRCWENTAADAAATRRVRREWSIASRGASLRRARGRGLLTGARPSAGASRRGLRDGVEPSKRRRRLDLRAVVLRGSDET